MSLKNKAIIVADAHENSQRRGFYRLLEALKNGELDCPQLILMGDIFDLLIYEIKATHSFAKPYIKILEDISDKTEVLYLEGNHDFNLANFFEKVKIFPIKNQALTLSCEKNLKITQKTLKQELKSFEFKGVKGVKIAHGDIFLKPLLSFALRSLRYHFLLLFLNFLDSISKNFISTKIKNKQLNKNLFYKIKDFCNIAKSRYDKYKCENFLVLEGHYHQNFVLNEDGKYYMNLDSFAYKESFFVVELL